ncbi:hypothetical protein [Sphingomonas turrisvirgatae]|uniref:Uncharacterized protein n=1 Tax=Sphingomonas turrisvirgatae TaxID=1888892 RepID=A0A1E3LV34_9SPHN|nr:hypothetical protein [Sphingomonas turrisvirgatae]ODP36690.1 hypothetical protein BFL28_05150 [Sphingomonas turrisvirgatae]
MIGTAGNTMSRFQSLFAPFGLLLGLSIVELLSGPARSAVHGRADRASPGVYLLPKMKEATGAIPGTR